MKNPFRRTNTPAAAAAPDPVLTAEQRRRVIEYGDAEPEPTAPAEDKDDEGAREVGSSSA